MGGKVGAVSDAARSVEDRALDDARPGKSTLIDGAPHPCDGASGPACHLSLPERADARLELMQRLANAGASFTGACVELRVQHYLDKEEPSILLKFLLETLGGKSTKLIEGGVKWLIARAKRRVDDAPVNADNVPLYLSKLAEHGALALQDLAHELLANGTDADIVAYRDAYDASHHTLDIYRSLLIRQLDKFKQSGILNMGTHRAIASDNKPGPFGASQLPVERTTRCAWLVHADGTRRLALVSDDQFVWAWDKIDLRETAAVKMVPEELWEAALHAHAKAHHAPPRDIPVPVPFLQLKDIP